MIIRLPGLAASVCLTLFSGALLAASSNEKVDFQAVADRIRETSDKMQADIRQGRARLEAKKAREATERKLEAEARQRELEAEQARIAQKKAVQAEQAAAAARKKEAAEQAAIDQARQEKMAAQNASSARERAAKALAEARQSVGIRAFAETEAPVVAPAATPAPTDAREGQIKQASENTAATPTSRGKAGRR
jgi:colicin import membrane protein